MRLRKLIILAVFLILVRTVSAQSLKPDAPYPLQSGINKGVADSLVGAQYWYFYALPGSNKLIVRFKTGKSLYGAQMNTNLTITVYDEKKTWKAVKVISARNNNSEAIFSADKVEKRQKILISVEPPNQNLLRQGGDYEIEVTGDVQFDEVKNAADPIIRTFASKVNSYGAVKFRADGKIETSNGSRGTWKLFDEENRIYTVIIDGQDFTVKYLLGYGLVRADSPDLIMFQEIQ